MSSFSGERKGFQSSVGIYIYHSGWGLFHNHGSSFDFHLLPKGLISFTLDGKIYFTITNYFTRFFYSYLVSKISFLQNFNNLSSNFTTPKWTIGLLSHVKQIFLFTLVRVHCCRIIWKERTNNGSPDWCKMWQRVTTQCFRWNIFKILEKPLDSPKN